MNKNLTLILLFGHLSIICNAQFNSKELVYLLMKNEIVTSVNFDQEFIKIGKDAIPYLIEEIDKKVIGAVGFVDERSSIVNSWGMNYIGIRAAYQIEQILADTILYGKHNRGVIFNSEKDKFLRTPLSYKDMKVIKKIYLNWWEQNCCKSIGDLNTEWNKKGSPLVTSVYKWL